MNTPNETQAQRDIRVGIQHPYNGRAPRDWAEAAALGICRDLSDRRGIKHEMAAIEGDEDVSEEIVTTLAEIIRTAQREWKP